MNNRSLSQRLKRLEEIITPETVHRVWQIVFVDSDGSTQEGDRIEWSAPAPVRRNVPALWKRR